MQKPTPLLLALVQPSSSTLTSIDWLAIAFYFAILLGVAWWVVTRRKDTAADYFLAGRNLGWWVIGASIFASNIGSEHIVGLAGSGAKDGVALAHYELHAWCLLVLAWVFVPFYARSLVFTMPEFLERRFCSNSRYVLSISSLLTFIVSKIAVGIFAGGVVFGTLLPEMSLSFGQPRPFTAEEIKQPAQVIEAMRKGTTLATAYVWTKLSEDVRQKLGSPATPVESQKSILAEEFNKLLKGEGLYSAERFGSTPLRAVTVKAIRSGATSAADLNRMVLEDVCPAKTLAHSVHEIDSFWLGSIAVIVLTGLYTMLGGMRAVAYNDAVQVVVLISGSALLTLYGLAKLGGWHELRALCGSDMFNLWKPLVPAGQVATWAPVKEMDAAGNIVRQAWYFNGNFPWLGMAICAPVIGLWYWCTDQYIVQRALGAPNEKVARQGSIFAAFLKLFPVYLFIIPGLICYALAKSGKIPALTEAFNQPNGAQGAFPLLVQHLLPPGLRGIVVAGLLSALMGSLAGVFNACSTLFTVDIYTKLRPAASQHEIVRMGRIATAIMVVIAMAWIPVVKGAHGLYNYLQSVQGYLAPPIFVVFFFGVFWKRLNAAGCLWAMIIGFVVGVFRMLVDTPCTLNPNFQYREGSFFWIINNINFQYFSILITLISAAVMVLFSYLTPPPDEKQIKGLTFATATAEDKAQTRASWGAREVLASLVVLVFIVGAYVYFRG